MQNIVVLLAQAQSEGRVFGLDQQTFTDMGIQLLNGIVLAIALGFILYKPVKKFMQERSEGIQSKIMESDETMSKANELIEEYEQKIKDIDKERIEILEAARIEATDEGKIILNEAKQEAEEFRQRSMESIAEEKKRLQEETRLYIIELASLMAEKYVTKNIDNEAQAKIFEETLAKLEETQWQH